MKEPIRDRPLSQTPVENNQNIGGSFATLVDTLRLDTPRLGNLRQRYGIDVLKVLQHPEDHSAISDAINAIKGVLKQEGVRADTELYIHLNYWLGRLHAMRQEYEECLKYWKTAEDAAQTDKNKYREYLRVIYTSGSINNAYLKRYSEAIRMRKILIEEYQGIGYGDWKNFVATSSVHNLAFMLQFAQGFPKEEAENIKQYLIELTKKYRGTEVGIAAVASLYSISKRAGDEQQAQKYLIEMNSYPSTPEFRIYSEGAIKMWEQIEEKRREKEKLEK